MEKKQKNYSWIVYALLLMGLIVWHLWANCGQRDDAWFKDVIEQNSLWDFLIFRYENWTSRLLIEGVLVLLVKADFWIWRVADSCVIVLGIYAAASLCNRQKEVKSVLLLALLFLLQPIQVLGSAGWIATTLNYIWPGCIGMYALIPLCRLWRREVIRKWEYGTFTLAVLFAGGMEQTLALLFGFYFTFAVAYIYREKKYHPQSRCLLPNYAIGMLVLMVGLLIFSLTCPGNANRSIAETQTWFPQYVEYTWKEKIGIGFLSTMSYYVSGAQRQVILTALVLVLALALWDRGKRTAAILASVGMLVCLLCVGGAYLPWFSEGGKYEGYYRLIENIYWPGHDLCGYSMGMVTVEILFFLLVCLALAGFLYSLYGASGKTALIGIILLAGLMSRFIIGFSATVYASGYRTTLFCSMAMIIITGEILLEISDSRKKAAGILAILLGVITTVC